MKKSVIIIYTFISLLVIQSCSSTENIRFEDMTEYELTRYNVLQSTPDQVVCFGPSTLVLLEDLLTGDSKGLKENFLRFVN